MIPSRLRTPALLVLALLASGALYAQSGSTAALPEAPGPVAGPAAGAAIGAVHGRVLSADGAPFPDGELTLVAGSGASLRATTDPDGSFLFITVPSGPFRIEVAGDGVQPATVSGTVAPGATLELPPVTLRLATVVTSVSAVSPEELAATQTAAEEHQRIFGAIPNFFVSYDPRVVPLSTEEKFRLSARTLFDPTNLAMVAGTAAGEQAIGMYPGFAHGPMGYGERFAAAFTDGATQVMFTGAILPTVFHQDPRYFYQGTGSRRSRFANVLRQAIEQRGDNGRWQFAWSNTLGDMGSALLSTSYYPEPPGSHGHQWGSVTATNFGLGIGSQAFANFLQEFFLGRLTTHTQP